MKSDMTIKDPFKVSEAKTVKVKFNFPLASPSFDPSVALKKAKEEKSGIAFDLQMHINFYEAGKIYDVPEEFYNKFSERTVETYNSNFGNFTGKSVKYTKRPVVPYLLKVDANGELLDPMQRELDLYAKEV